MAPRRTPCKPAGFTAAPARAPPMPVSLAAALDLCGPTLRYAAVARGPVPRLRRLGEVTFESDVWALLDRSDTAALGGLGIERLTVVDHAPDAPTRTAAVPASHDGPARDARLAREADVLLADEADYGAAFGTAPITVAAAALGTDGSRAWVQAVALTPLRRRSLDALGAALGLASVEVHVGPHAASGVLPALVAPTLAVGLYDADGRGNEGFAEFALVVGGGVRLVGYAPTAEPVDAAFAALRLVASVGRGPGIGALALYGPGAGRRDVAEAFEAAFGVPARPIDALGGVALPGQRGGSLDAAAALVAPVVGAALAGLDA